MSILPHVSKLHADYLAMGEQGTPTLLRNYYGSKPDSGEWMKGTARIGDTHALADALNHQASGFRAGEQSLKNIVKIREGARVVVTGQQVGLLGGPLLTLLKAATAIARAQEATTATGVAHVPVFWLATEDHDLAEVDHISLLSKHAVETLRLGLHSEGAEVGGLRLGEGIVAVLEHSSELLGHAPICDLLHDCYRPDATLGSAFGRWMTQLFASYGLIVLDASGPEFHKLGRATLRFAIEHAEELELALLRRAAELTEAGYHAQVLVKPGSSLLFLVSDGQHGAKPRQALRRSVDGSWKAGGRGYSTAELLRILEREPERLSPNALLRPVFQDTILPTAAYVGGPAEIAYFAQTAVLYQHIFQDGEALGRVTPVLPRFSATLIEPLVAALMAKDDLRLDDIFAAKTVDALTHRLGARSMPIEAKRRLGAVGNAMHDEVEALTSYLCAMDESLGRSAMVSASKMRYQMNRLRRLAATFEVQKNNSLRKQAHTMMLHLFPSEHPQERILGGVWFLAQAGEGLIDTLVREALTMCLGHTVLKIT